MQKVINILTNRVNKLNERKKEVFLILDEPELSFDYHFAKNEIENIDIELDEIRKAVNIILSVKP